MKSKKVTAEKKNFPILLNVILLPTTVEFKISFQRFCKNQRKRRNYREYRVYVDVTHR